MFLREKKTRSKQNVREENSTLHFFSPRYQDGTGIEFHNSQN